MKSSLTLTLALGMVLLTGMIFNNTAGADMKRVSGQTIYLSVYPQVPRAKKLKPLSMVILISIRNTDPKHSIKINAIDFYDGEGNLKNRVNYGPSSVGPLAVKSIRIEPGKLAVGKEIAGSFIIKWQSDQRVLEPICESISAVPTTMHSGELIFTGRVIQEY